MTSRCLCVFMCASDGLLHSPRDCLRRRSRQNENIINQYPTTAVFDKFLSDAWCFTTVNKALSLSSRSQLAVLLLLLGILDSVTLEFTVFGKPRWGRGGGKGRGHSSCSYFCVRCHRCLGLHIQRYRKTVCCVFPQWASCYIYGSDPFLYLLS